MRAPLLLERDHLVVRLDGGLWILDTGSPFSFGRADWVELGGARIPVPDEAFGLKDGTGSPRSPSPGTR